MSSAFRERGPLARQRVHQMSVYEAFQGLTQQERFYAHHLSRAAWHGARIILRQVSEESALIFDLILEIHNALSGDWQSLAERAKVDVRDAESFLEFSSSFLSDIGNYSGRGDSKITPNVTTDCMDRIASVSQRATELWTQIGHRLLSKPPFSLGFPSETTTSAYYPGLSRITKDEVSMVSRVMELHQVFPENPRLRKTEIDNTPVYDILQASVETDLEPRLLPNNVSDATVRLVRGEGTLSDLHTSYRGCKVCGQPSPTAHHFTVLRKFPARRLED
ncbi:hypothetical protein PV04_07998 [Phialophora macrospora]|uniref:Uncharacterized protein n=1 Tax=Phialophora macrospora TaxID=1851006 RepID=A0A0D2CKD1_9EURO|nr:hypothetical protein PV04_07998 [Phialophora macrospora]